LDRTEAEQIFTEHTPGFWAVAWQRITGRRPRCQACGWRYPCPEARLAAGILGGDIPTTPPDPDEWRYPQ
jgi:hypothetical protein